MKVLRIISLFFLGLIAGCYYDVEEEIYSTVNCDIMDISYQNDIDPILRNNCFLCHSSTANFGNITLESYQNAKKYADSGQLAGAINHENGFSPMPKGGPKIRQCDIEKIEAWIADGAPNN